MAFTQASNFRTVWSAETTLQFFRRLTLGSRMNGTWEGDAQTNDKVHVQNPNYNVDVQGNTVARKAAWGTPNEPSAAKIDISIDQRQRVENMLYVEDEEVNAVRNYRSRLQAATMDAMAIDYEDRLVAYMEGLTAGGNHGTTDNGNAGQITEIELAPVSGQGFARSTGKPSGNDTQKVLIRRSLEEFLTDCKVQLERDDVMVEGGSAGIGGSYGRFWAAMPPELYAYGLAASLEDRGLSLEFTAQVIRDLGVFGTAFGGTYKGFDLFVSNAIAKPSSNTDSWFAFAGSPAAVAAPSRMINNYVRTPANASNERYEFRHTRRFGRQLVNSKLLYRGKFAGQGNP